MGGLFSEDLGSAAALSTVQSEPSGLARWLAARREGLILAALGLLAFGLTLYLFTPGYMGPDARTQLQQARDFEFRDDHPVLMALLWHYLDRLAPGPLGIFVFTSALHWVGLTALFWVLPGSLGWRALGLLGLGAFPPLSSTLPIVLKDSIMHGALFLAIACVVPPTRRALAARAVLGLACFALAIGVRHNAAAAVWPFLALPLLRLQLLARLRPWLRLGVTSAAGLVLAFLMTRGVDRALAPLSHRTEFWQMVPTYDLAGMSLKVGEVLVPDSPLVTKGMGLEQLEQLFRVDYGNALYYCIGFGGRRCVPFFRYTLEREELEQWSREWRNAILHYPGAYLAHRWELTRAMLTVNRSGKELYYLAGSPHGPLAAEYPPTERLEWLLTFFERHIRSKVYSPWLYVIAGLLLMPIALLRFLRSPTLRPEAVLPLLFAFSGSAYMLSNLVGAVSTTYRYCVWTIACTLLALFAFAAPRSLRALVERLRAPAPRP